MVGNVLLCSVCHNRRRRFRTYYFLLTTYSFSPCSLLLAPYSFKEEVLPREQYGAVRGRRRPEAGDAATGVHRRADGDELVRGVPELRTRPAPHMRPEARHDLPTYGKGIRRKE